MKKFAALFVMTLVMALNVTTVMAASPEFTGATIKGLESEAGVVSCGTVTTVTQADQANAAKAAVADENVSSITVLDCIDLSIPGVTPTPANPVNVTIKYDEITANSNVVVLNYGDHDGDGTSEWVECAIAGKGAGYVTATFTHFSPVLVMTYTVATAAPAPTPSTNTTPSNNYVDTTPASPKTGVLPVAAIAAGICLAGAAVCGKKVKFN